MIVAGSGYTQLTPDMRMCRILNGMWQVSGGHGRIHAESAITQMMSYHDAGFTTWDMADHYGPAEDLMGAFRQRVLAERGEEALGRVRAFTKWVPRPGPMSRERAEQAVQASLRRLGVATLDLLQFHWWDYADEGYLDALKWLAELREKGLIHHLGLTNFDSRHMARIVDAGIPIVTNQVAYSLIDTRPEVEMAEVCRRGGVQLLTYGTVLGGLLSEAYLGEHEPSESQLNTLSLRKYKQVIDDWGGWELFQELLAALKQVADAFGVSLANVATRAILDRPHVVGVIIGTRLGVSEHIAENAQVFRLDLKPSDLDRVNEILSRGNDLYALVGDCGAEYRAPSRA